MICFSNTISIKNKKKTTKINGPTPNPILQSLWV